MAFMKFQIRPGINKDITDYSNEGGWVDCDKIRFVSGFPQKIGGWTKFSHDKFKGVCRSLFRWITTYSETLVAVGTSSKLYLHRGNNLYDITPLRERFESPDTDNSIGTEDGSTTLTIALNNHGLFVGDYLQITGATGSLSGIPEGEINTEHQVVDVIDVNTFAIEVSTPATATTSVGGTNITITADVSIGSDVTDVGYGWGSSEWGAGTWGVGDEDAEESSGVAVPLRMWWTTNYDNDLIANVHNGRIYHWERGSTTIDTALANRAVELYTLSGADEVPRLATQVMVSPTYRHLLAFGATPYGDTSGIDPLLIRWASQDSLTEWTPRLTNSAGFLRLSSGREIRRAAATRQEILIWTESSLDSLQYLGTSDVFGLHNYANNLTLMSPKAVVVSRDIVYWMGKGQFYMYNGRVVDLPCTLQSYVFNDISQTQSLQVFGATNERFHEIWWFYPSAGSRTIDRYVVYNYLTGVWYHGEMERTAWLDGAEVDYPQGAGYDGYIYDHENGPDADGLPMASFIQSSDLSMGSGDEYFLINRVVPDLTFRGASSITPEVEFSVYPRDFPGVAPRPDPFDKGRVVSGQVGQYTEQIFIRARARQMAMRIASDKLGVSWQLGTPRVDARTSGRR